MTRPLYLRRASEAHSPKRRRFDFGRGDYLGISWAVLNAGLAVNGYFALQHGELVIASGCISMALASSVGEIVWIVLHLRSRRDERSQWRSMARRMAFLKQEIARREKGHQPRSGLVAELRELNNRVLAGR